MEFFFLINSKYRIKKELHFLDFFVPSLSFLMSYKLQTNKNNNNL